MFNKTQLSMLLVLAVWSLTGCSRETESPSAGSGAASASKTPTVLIERERRWDNPEAYIQFTRKVIKACQNGLAAAGGSEPAGDLSDAEILALDTVVTLEVFDGNRYAEIQTSSSLNRREWGSDSGQSCIPTSQRSRSISIHLPCSRIEVIYDSELPGGGTRKQWDGDCAKPPFHAEKSDYSSHMKGERMAIEGTDLHCRWVQPKGSEWGRSCLLEPWFQYPESLWTDRDLRVQTESSTALKSVAMYQPVAEAAVFAEHPLRVEVGKPLPPGIFEVPADARGFPLTVEGAK